MYAHVSCQLHVLVCTCVYVNIYCRKSSDMLSKEFDKNPDEFARSFSMDVSLDDPSQGPEKDPAVMLTSPLSPIGEADEDDASEAMTPHTKVVHYWMIMCCDTNAITTDFICILHVTIYI